MELIDYIKVFRRRWTLLAVCLLVGVLAALVTTPEKTSATPVATSYTAYHTLVRNPAGQATDLGIARLFVTTGQVPVEVAKEIGYQGSPAVLATMVSATEDEQDGTLVISTTDSDPAAAVERADAFARQLVAYLTRESESRREAQEQQTRSQVNEMRSDIDRLQGQLTGATESERPLLQAEIEAYSNQYRVAFERLVALQQQTVDSAPLVTLQAASAIPTTAGGRFTAPTNRTTRTAIGGLLGILLGALAALVLERLDTRLRTRAEVESAFGASVVAEVPRLTRGQTRSDHLMVRDEPASEAAEAYRSLRSSLSLLPLSPGLGGDTALVPTVPQVVLVTSCRPRDGKSTTVANLAVSFAEVGKSVLVLDCDLRAPDMHRMFDVPDGPGVSDLLAARRPEELRNLARPSSVPGVRLLTSGSATDLPGVLLASMSGLIRDARLLADIVLIDTPPVLTANDTTDLLPHADAVIIVSRHGRTTTEQAGRLRELISRLRVPVHGVCLVSSPVSRLRPREVSYVSDGARSGLLQRLTERGESSSGHERADETDTGRRA